MSGTWEDDSNNWEKAFNTNLPDDVQILHSYYARMPHWSYEFEYYFEVNKNDMFKTEIVSNYKLGRSSLVRSYKSSKSPNWFLPKEIESYKLYQSNLEELSNFKMFEDKETGNLYLSDYLF